MIKAIVLKWKTLACLFLLLTWIDTQAQCGLTITNPPCSAGPVNLTSAAITAGSTNVGVLTYWMDPQATVPLANPSAVANAGFYYIKNTVGACSSVAPVQVTIGSAAPTGVSDLDLLCNFSNSSSLWFDFDDVGQTSFSYSYQINGGPIVYGSQFSPSSYVVGGLSVGDEVIFTVSFNGVCHEPLKAVGYPTATPNFTTPQTLCIGTVLPTTSPNGISGFWNKPVVLGGTQNYTFVPVACQIPQIVTITAVAPVTPTFNPIAPICEGSPAPALPANSTNAPAIPGTWNPAAINTATPGTQVFTFTPAAGQCATGTTTLSVTVTPRITPTFAAYPASLCQNAPAPVLPTTSSNGVTGTWSPASINTATTGLKTSTFTPNPGQCVSATPVTVSVNVVQSVVPTFNPIAPFCAGTAAPSLPAASIEGVAGTWSPAVISNTASGTYTFTPNAGQCGTTATLNVTVTPAPTTIFNAFPTGTLTICSGSPVPALPLFSSNVPSAVTGTWNPPVISNTVSGTYTFTPTAGQCASPFTLNVTITPTTAIQFNALPNNLPICVGTPPPPLPSQSDNTPPITGTWNAAAIDTATPGVRTYTFQAAPGQCVASFFYTIFVDVTPKTQTIYGPILPFCEGTVPPQGLALPTIINGISGTWSAPAIDNTIVGLTTYHFTPDAGECADPSILNINIIGRDITTFAQQQIPGFCAGTTPIPTLPTISDNGITGTWNPPVIDNMHTQTYFFTPDPSFCATVAMLTVTVQQPVDPVFDGLDVQCANDIQALPPVSDNGISGTWNPSVVDPTLPSAVYTFTPDPGECANVLPLTIVVHQLTLTSVSVLTTGGYFTNHGTVTVTALGPGNYLYQLEDGPMVTNNVFLNVPPGVYDVTVYDVNGCSAPITLEDEVKIIGYPRFFTPNGDGFNETWNIFDLRNVGQDQATIFIFDRHGKLIKQIAPAGDGWDGTYNGQPLPSSDYWFLVRYYEQLVPREFKAHFSLKR